MGRKIFINYRRAEDGGAVAGRLRRRLEKDFGRDRVFMDTVGIPVGSDFKVHLNSQLADCDVMLVVIGSRWLRAKQKARLNQPDDPVASEIAVALERNIPVIPVLVDGARIPNASDLPDALKTLASRQAVDVRNAYLDSDAGVMIARMRETVPGLLAEPPQTEALAPLGDQLDHPAGPVRAFITNILMQGGELLQTAISHLRAGKLQGWPWVLVFLVAIILLVLLVIFCLILWLVSFGGDVPKGFIDSAATAGRAVGTAVKAFLSRPKF